MKLNTFSKDDNWKGICLDVTYYFENLHIHKTAYFCRISTRNAWMDDFEFSSKNIENCHQIDPWIPGWALATRNYMISRVMCIIHDRYSCLSFHTCHTGSFWCIWWWFLSPPILNLPWRPFSANLKTKWFVKKVHIVYKKTCMQKYRCSTRSVQKSLWLLANKANTIPAGVISSHNTTRNKQLFVYSGHELKPPLPFSCGWIVHKNAYMHKRHPIPGPLGRVTGVGGGGGVTLHVKGYIVIVFGELHLSNETV